MELELDGKAAFAATGGRPFEPDQPTIVFVHGGGADHTVWALQTRYLAHRGNNVLAVDLPGHGRSAGPVLETIDDMTAWVIQLLDALDVGQAAIVGHSMGSLVALNTALVRGDRVGALALLGTSLPMPVTEQLLSAAKSNDDDAFDMLTIWGHSRGSQIGGNSAPGLWMTGEGLRLLERSGPGVLHADLKACNDYAITPDDVAGITCPTLLVIGTKDIMTPVAGAEAVAAKIEGARTIKLAGCGHMLMAEEPGKVLDALTTIL